MELNYYALCTRLTFHKLLQLKCLFMYDVSGYRYCDREIRIHIITHTYLYYMQYGNITLHVYTIYEIFNP